MTLKWRSLLFQRKKTSYDRSLGPSESLAGRSEGNCLFPFWGKHCVCTVATRCWALWSPQRLNLSIPHSLPSQNVISHTDVSVSLLHILQSITLVGPEGKANPQYFQACTSKCLSAYRNTMPYKLIVSSLACPPLMWCKSTNFNNQIMEAQHKKLWLFWSHHDPWWNKLWQGASLPLSVMFLGGK